MRPRCSSVFRMHARGWAPTHFEPRSRLQQVDAAPHDCVGVRSLDGTAAALDEAERRVGLPAAPGHRPSTPVASCTSSNAIVQRIASHRGPGRRPQLHLGGKVTAFGPDSTLVFPRTIDHQSINTGSANINVVATFAGTGFDVHFPDGQGIPLPRRTQAVAQSKRVWARSGRCSLSLVIACVLESSVQRRRR